MRTMTTLMIAAVLAVAAPAAVSAAEFTTAFFLGDCAFATTGDNPYFPLRPGTEAKFSNRRCVNAGDCDELETNTIKVLNLTRAIALTIGGKPKVVQTRVIRELEGADGAIVEISRNFFAQCNPFGDVYYFGEEVDIFEDGQVSHDGAWLAGRRNARPGLIMPGGAVLLGSRYFQEVAPGVALDRAEHVDEGFSIEVPAGTFDRCIEVRETTPLEPGDVSTKIYCRGVGLVVDDDLELVSITGN
jgi:hypothetical protein